MVWSRVSNLFGDIIDMDDGDVGLYCDLEQK